MPNTIPIPLGEPVDLRELSRAASQIRLDTLTCTPQGHLFCRVGAMPTLVDPMVMCDVRISPAEAACMQTLSLTACATAGHRLQVVFYSENSPSSFGVTLPITPTGGMQTYEVSLLPVMKRLLAQSPDDCIVKIACILPRVEGAEITIASLLFGDEEAAASYAPVAENRAAQEGAYIPAPQPAATDYLVGALYFPGWKTGTHIGWKALAPFPERTPLLGYYEEGNPEVCDWEIKWALEHGISFFAYCWYGLPWSDKGDNFNCLNHAIHDGLFHARFAKDFKFAINFCAHWGIRWLGDLVRDLFPFWMETYFKHPSYLTVDQKPLVLMYDVEKIVEEIGESAFSRALETMRELARAEGFAGITFVGMYWGTEPQQMQRFRDLGFDYGYAYCNWAHWTSGEQIKRPTAAAYIRDQQENIRAWQNGPLPYIPTISNMWDPIAWYSPSCGALADMPRWRLKPEEYEELARWTKAQMDSREGKDSLSRVLLLDNWNEYSEGHFIAPHREYAFAYLDAIRRVFTHDDGQTPHRHLMPEDVGLGPYNTAYAESPEDRTFCFPPLDFDPEALI